MSGRYDNIFSVSKYYDDGEKRIFSIVNIPENEEIFKKYKVSKNDYFMAILSWQHDKEWFIESYNILVNYNINPDNFYILCNTKFQLVDALNVGFKNAFFINRHFNLDYNYYKVDKSVVKDFDACIFGEQHNRNRIPLSFGVNKLAIVDGNAKWNKNWNYPKDAWRNLASCGTNGMIIQETMRKSWCGLCLSEKESMCWSSLEFFYNGIPVVTTNNHTGRMEWYDSNNSIVLQSITPSLEEIENAIQLCKGKINDGSFDSEKIRNDAIQKSEFFRNEFVNMTSRIIGDDNVAKECFITKYEQRMLYEKHWKSFDDTLKLLNNIN